MLRTLHTTGLFRGMAVLLAAVFFLSGCLPFTRWAGTPPPTPAPPTRIPRFPLAGTWQGRALNGDFEMQVTLVIREDCSMGGACGSFDLAEIPCAGSYTLIGLQDGVYEFQVGDKVGACGTGRDYLQLLSDGTLQYTSRGDYGETFGSLTRVPPISMPDGEKLPVIYDDDGSPDGTSALLYLLSRQDVDLKAVCISYGEAHPATYIQFIGGMLEHYGYGDIPLGAGPDVPLAGSNGFPEWLRDGADGFWGYPVWNAGKTYPVQDSADLVISVLQGSPEPVNLFYSGPLTNLARALRKAPGIVDKIAGVYIMGGAVYVPGNVHDFYPDSANTYAEWNIFADPTAASEVLRSGLSLYMVPLDATNQVTIDRGDTRAWRAGGELPDFAADIYDGLMNSNGGDDFAIWDLMTAGIMLEPGHCAFQPLRLEVVTTDGSTSGQTRVLPGGEPNAQICLQPSGDLIRQALIDTFANMP